MHLRLLGFPGILFIAFSYSTATAAADFGKQDTSWDKITPAPSAEKWNLGSEGFMTYTGTVGQSATHPVRHSYGWIHLYGNYQIVPGYNVSALLTAQKTSFSHDLSYDPFLIRAFPQFSFDGTMRQLLPFEGLPDSNHRIRFQAGTIPMFRHGQGLYYSQFTGVGALFAADLPWLSFEIGQLGYGYYSGDDIRSAFLYVPGRYFGIGVLQETSTPLGDRIIPGIAGEIIPLKFLRVYYEGGSSWVYGQSGAKTFSYYGDSYDMRMYPSYYIDLSRVGFSNDFMGSGETLSGLAGFDLHWSKVFGIVERMLFSNQLRYYGAEATNFYELQRRSHFNFFTDLTTDQRYNNQPYNFYLYPGAALGAYFMQEIDLLPWRFLKIKLRNELTFIRSENGYAQTGYSPKNSGNDVVSLITAITLEEKLNMGIKISNVIIGNIEYGTTFSQIQANRTPFMLEASKYWFIDIFMHYRI